MIGMFLMATFLCVNLSSCSDDDDEEKGGAASGLAGTWGLTHDMGWDKYNGETVNEWDVSLDPRNPVGDDDMKIVITKADGNKYNIKYYEFNGEGWEHVEGEDVRASVEGSVITDLDDPTNTIFFSLNNNQLVLEYKEVHEQDDFYNKMTFIRM